MATNTYAPLANITLTSTAASVTFSGISQSYRDLILIGNFNGTNAGEIACFQLNGDTGSNYFGNAFRGNGSTIYAGTFPGTFGQISAYGGFTSNFEVNITNFMDYSATDKHKTIIYRSNIADSKTEAGINRWANTAAITSIKLFPMSTGIWAIGTNFTLYGIAA